MFIITDTTTTKCLPPMHPFKQRTATTEKPHQTDLDRSAVICAPAHRKTDTLAQGLSNELGISKSDDVSNHEFIWFARQTQSDPELQEAIQEIKDRNGLFVMISKEFSVTFKSIFINIRQGNKKIINYLMKD